LDQNPPVSESLRQLERSTRRSDDDRDDVSEAEHAGALAVPGAIAIAVDRARVEQAGAKASS
jgi:hypothetical protein